jgi:hypothetical protein
MPCTRHRVFLATLIVASKYLNDSSPKNKHWREHAVLFDIVEINLMEKQLLLLLEYELRFDEFEACMVFAPFMATVASVRRQKESEATTRAAAVDRVIKGGKARAQAQMHMPPTPPHDAVIVPNVPASSLASTVRGIAKRLSTTHLSARQSKQQLRVPIPSPMYSTLSNDSTSGSEMGSLVDDNGSSSSSSECASGSEDDFEDNQCVEARPLKKFVLRPVPSYAYRQQPRGRKPSDTSSITSTATVTNSPLSTSASQWLDRDAYIRRSSAGSRSSSISYGSTCPPCTAQGGAVISASATMPTLVPQARMSGGFLSRMWGAATNVKGQQDRDGGIGDGVKGQCAPLVGIVEPIEPGPPNAFRRLVLVHSKSTLFRAGDV